MARKDYDAILVGLKKVREEIETQLASYYDVIEEDEDTADTDASNTQSGDKNDGKRNEQNDRSPRVRLL